MTKPNPQVIALMGAIARIGDDGLEDNPHAEDSGAWHVWRYGWRTKCRRELAGQEARSGAGATGKGACKTVSRGTVSARGEERGSATGKQASTRGEERGGATGKDGPGRGHARLGRRPEWTGGEIAALALATGWISDLEIGAMLGKSRRAVISQRNRQKGKAA